MSRSACVWAAGHVLALRNPNCLPPLGGEVIPKNWSCGSRKGWPDDPGVPAAIAAIYAPQDCEHGVGNAMQGLSIAGRVAESTLTPEHKAALRDLSHDFGAGGRIWPDNSLPNTFCYRKNELIINAKADALSDALFHARYPSWWTQPH